MSMLSAAITHLKSLAVLSDIVSSNPSRWLKGRKHRFAQKLWQLHWLAHLGVISVVAIFGGLTLL